jgi:hypothetical protein
MISTTMLHVLDPRSLWQKVAALKLWEDARLDGGFPLARPAPLTCVPFYLQSLFQGAKILYFLGYKTCSSLTLRYLGAYNED